MSLRAPRGQGDPCEREAEQAGAFQRAQACSAVRWSSFGFSPVKNRHQPGVMWNLRCIRFKLLISRESQLFQRDADRSRLQGDQETGSALADKALACAAMRLMVARCTRKIRAISAPGRPAASIANISALCRGMKLGSPPALSALFARRLQPRTGSLAYHGALEFGEGSKHLHHHASGRSGVVSRR